MAEELLREEVTGCMDRAVEELLDQARVTGPSVDALALVRSQPGVRFPAGRKRAVPRPAPTEEQRQWEAARALGTHLKASLLARLGIDAGEQQPMGVSLANLFAERLLVPTRWFAVDAASTGYDLEELKNRYRTASYELLAWRLLDLLEPCIITIVDNDSILKRRSNAWRVKKQLEPAEKECQQYVSERGEAHEARADGWTVQGWPIPHAGWKRVILRSVVNADVLT